MQKYLAMITQSYKNLKVKVKSLSFVWLFANPMDCM